MADRPDTIALRIALDGAEDILARLKELGAEGEKAFKQLNDAVAATTGTFGNFGSGIETAIQNVEAGIGHIGDVIKSVGDFKLGNVTKEFNDFEGALKKVVTRATEVQGAIIGIATALVALERVAVQNVADIGKEATALGLASDRYQELQFAAAASGVEQDKFLQGVKNLAKGVNDLATAQQKAQFAADAKFGIINVSQLQQFGLVGQLADQVRTKLDAMGLRVVGVGEQFETLRARMVASGVRFVQTELNVSGLSEGLGTAAKALNDMGIKVFDSEGKLKTLDQLLPDIADGFKKLGAGPEGVAKAVAIFGRTGNDLLPLLVKGKAGLADLTAAFKALGISLSESDIKQAEAANAAWVTLTFTLGRVKDQLALVFSPLFLGVVEAVTAAVVRNYGSWKQLGTVIAQNVKPVVDDIIALLEGKEAKTEFVNRWVAAWGVFKDVTLKVFDVVKAAFALFVEGLELVSKKLDEFFGIKIDPTTLGIVIVLGVITGAFTAVIAAVTLATSLLVTAFGVISLVVRGIASIAGGLLSIIRIAVVGIAAITGLPALVVIAIAAAVGIAVALVIKYWDQIAAGWAALWKTIGDAANSVWQGIKDIWNTIASDAAQAWEDIKTTAKALWDFLTGGFVGVITGALSKAWEALKTAAAAAWDFVVEVANKALDNIKAVFAAIGSFFTGAFSKLTEAAEAAWKFVSDKAAEAWDAISKVFGGAGDKLSPAWEAIKTGAAGAWNTLLEGAVAIVVKISAALQPIAAAVVAPLSKLVDGVVEAFTSMVAAGKALADAITRVTSAGFDLSKLTEVAAALLKPFTDADTQIRAAIAGLIEFFGSTGSKLVTAITTAFAGIDASLQGTSASIKKTVDGIVAQVAIAVDAADRAAEAARRTAAAGAPPAQPGAPAGAVPGGDVTAGATGAVTGGTDLNAIITGIVEAFTRARERIAQIFTDITAAATTFGSTLLSSAQPSLDALVNAMNQAAAAAEQAADRIRRAADAARQAAQEIAGAEDGGGGLAGGGQVFGPGTTTSDSIPTWLSHFEFVINADQVRRLGVGFMQFINEKGTTLIDIVRRLGIKGYNLGGLAGAIPAIGMPSFDLDFASPFSMLAPRPLALAGGGQALNSGRTLILDFGGGNKFQARTTESVGDSLEKFVAIRRVKSAGRAPSSVT